MIVRFSFDLSAIMNLQFVDIFSRSDWMVYMIRADLLLPRKWRETCNENSVGLQVTGEKNYQMKKAW